MINYTFINVTLAIISILIILLDKDRIKMLKDEKDLTNKNK